MSIRSLSSAALFSGLAALTGGAHAAWGHSDHAHVEAYRHLQAAVTDEGRAGAAIDPTPTRRVVHKEGMIRALDPAFDENARSRARPGERS